MFPSSSRSDRERPGKSWGNSHKRHKREYKRTGAKGSDPSPPALFRFVGFQVHGDARGSRAVFGAFVADPEVRWSDGEPEVGLRQKRAKNIQRSELRHQFKFVAFVVAGGCFDAFPSPKFELHFIKMRLIREQVHRLRLQMVERKESQNTGDALSLQRIGWNGKVPRLGLFPIPLAFEAHQSFCRIEGFSLGIDDAPARVANGLLGSKRAKSAISRPQRVDLPGNFSGKPGILAPANFSEVHGRPAAFERGFHCPFRCPALRLSGASHYDAAAFFWDRLRS